jgi:hypothetical protein
MKKLIGLLFVFISLSTSVFAQENKSFVRFGIGSGFQDEPLTFGIEYGKIFGHWEAGVKFTYYNTFPFKDEYRGMQYLDNGIVQNIVHAGIGNYYYGTKYLSFTLNAGYNLFSLFSDRHNFTPFVAVGYGGLTKMDHIIDAGLLRYYYTFTFEYGFGARYEYAVSDNIRLGLYYEYYNHLERDVLGAHIIRVF